MEILVALHGRDNSTERDFIRYANAHRVPSLSTHSPGRPEAKASRPPTRVVGRASLK